MTPCKKTGTWSETRIYLICSKPDFRIILSNIVSQVEDKIDIFLRFLNENFCNLAGNTCNHLLQTKTNWRENMGL